MYNELILIESIIYVETTEHVHLNLPPISRIGRRRIIQSFLSMPLSMTMSLLSLPTRKLSQFNH